MEIYETRTIPECKREVFTNLKCDLCGKESNKNYARSWKKETYDELVTCISYKKGHCFPDGGYGEELHVDLCPNCFESKLIPWLKEQGVNTELKEYDY